MICSLIHGLTYFCNNPMVKLVRNSIKQSKANYLSIDNLERQIYDQDYGTGSNQYSSSSFDMMNTLMVMIFKRKPG